MSGDVEAPRAAASPYKGLTHFTEDDFGLFFGRERERAVIVANLKARRLTVLYGESGVGKSSLLRAGVMRALREQAHHDFDDADVGRPEYVPAIAAAWSGDPLRTVIDALASAAAPFVTGPPQLPTSRRLDATIDALTAQTDARLLVILDQLEEYFLYHGDEAGEGTLASELPRALARPQLRASFLLSIREDALAKLDRFKRDVPELFDTVLAIGPLDREAARHAIVGPLRTFEGSGPKDAEPELVEAVLDQVAAGQLVLEGAGQGRVEQDGGAPATRAIEAPYLQLVLARLWEEERDPHTLRLATLERLGGAEAIVRRHLDTALAGLDEPERLVAADALRYLVTPSGTKIALGPDDLASFTGRPDVAPVLEKLTGAGARILRAVGATPGQPNGTRYEIAHDVLGAAVLDWRSRFVREQERLELERRAVAEREQLEEEKREAEEREAAERRRARIFRALAGTALTLLLAAVAFLAYALVEKGRAEHAQRVTQSQLRAAEARSALGEGDLDVAIPLALAAYRGSHSATVEDTLLQAVHDSTGLRRLLRFGAPVEGMAVDPLGNAIAAAVGRTLVLRATGGAVVARRPTRDVARGVAFSRDGRFVAAGLENGTVALFHVRRAHGGHAVALEGLRPLPSFGGVGVAKSVAFSPSGRWIAAATDRGVVVWPLHGAVAGEPRLLRAAQGLDFARGVAFCAASRGHAERVAAAFDNGRVVLWSLGREAPARILQDAGPFSMGSVACSPDGTLLAAGGDAQVVTLFRPDRRAQPTRLTGHRGGIEALAFGGGGRVLASGADDDSVILWDIPSLRQLGPPLRAHAEPVVAVGFDRGGATLAAASRDRHVSVWSAEEPVRAGGGIHVVPSHLNAASFGDGFFAAATSAGQVVVRSAARPELRGPVPPASYPKDKQPTTITLDPGGRWLALGLPNDVQLFRLRRGTPREQTLGGPRSVERLALARDGTLAAGLDDGTIRLWQAPPHGTAFSGLRPPSPQPGSPADALAIDDEGDNVAAAYRRRVVLWRPGEDAVDLHGADGVVTDLAFGAGGLLAAAAGNAIVVWDVETARLLAAMPTGGSVAAVAFSRDGHWLASTGADGPVRIWDVEARRQLGEPLPTPPRAPVSALGFTDTATLSAAYSDGTAAAWNLGRWQLGTSFDAIRADLLRTIGRRGAAS
jgi:WD40 repeat protein